MEIVKKNGYIEYYEYMREVEGVDEVVNMGKNGNMEWMKGKEMEI